MTNACFTIDASADAQVMPRIFEHFAMRGLLPSRVVAESTTQHIRLSIYHSGIDPGLALLIANKIRSAVSVRHVELTSHPSAGESHV